MTTNKLTHKGSWTSLLLGGPIGVIFIALFCFAALMFVTTVTQEGLPGIGLYYYFRIPVLTMTTIFILSLWPTGRLAEYLLRQDQPLLSVAFKYSVVTNIVCCLTLLLTVAISYNSLTIDLFFVIIPFLLTTLLSTFTIGLLICYVIRRRITSA